MPQKRPKCRRGGPFLLTILVFFAAVTGYPAGNLSAHIEQAEYFFDSDPGEGNGTALEAVDEPFDSNEESVDLSGIDLSGLKIGSHTLYVRFKNSDGAWGLARPIPYDTGFKCPHNFRITGERWIAAAEYFFDTDPGEGNGTPVEPADGVFGDPSVALELAGIDISHLPVGTHTLYIRFQDNEGTWSLAREIFFEIYEPSTIAAAEYFIDGDPGPGNGVPLTAKDGEFNFAEEDVELADIDTTGLAVGAHTLSVRFKDQLDRWGALRSQPFAVGRPIAYSPTIPAQAATGDGRIPLSVIVVDHVGSNTCKLRVDYALVGSDDWVKITVENDSVSATYGAPGLDNTAAYQIGGPSGWIWTASGPNTIGFTWLSREDLGDAGLAGVRLRFTIHNGTEEHVTSTETDPFQVDSQLPAAPCLIPYKPDPTGDRTPTLTWHRVPDAFTYRVQISTGHGFTILALDKSNISKTCYTPTTPLPFGRIFWRVSAFDNLGNESPFSFADDFVIIEDLDAPSVVLSYSDPSPVSAGPLTITAVFSEPLVSVPWIAVDQSGAQDLAQTPMRGAGTTWSYMYTVTCADGSSYIDGAAAVSIGNGFDSAGNENGPAQNDTFIISTGECGSGNIIAAEYFFDSDPGEGNAIGLQAADGFFNSNEESVDLSGIDLSGLKIGSHSLFVRFKNSDGVWGVARPIPYDTGFKSPHNFRITGQRWIAAAEYFFDNDPGEGNGTPVEPTGGVFGNRSVELELSGIDVSHLPVGTHTFYLRLQDNEGTWSLARETLFEIDEHFVIEGAEYFIDEDPGPGNGEPLTAKDGHFDSVQEEVELSEIDTTGLTIGDHTLSVRFKDSRGRWGNVVQRAFLIKLKFEWPPVPGAIGYELQVDDDCDNFSTPEIYRFYEDTVSDTFDNYLPDGDYCWRVRPVFGENDFGEWVDMGLFSQHLPTSPAPVWVPLYRLYKEGIHDHYYTTIPAHRDAAVNDSGYVYEKIECYVSDRKVDDPNCGYLFHLYHSGDDVHFYTSSESEKNSKMAAGFSYEGIVGFLYASAGEGLFPLAHAEHVANTDHFYTISKFEFDNAIDLSGWGFEDRGFVGYVSSSGLEDPTAHSRPQANFGGVDLGSGAFRGVNSLDLAMKGRGPTLSFRHYYNSLNFNRYPMGQGWSHNLCSYIIESISGTDPKVFVIWGNGTISEFTQSGPGPSDYVDETGHHYQLSLVDDGINFGYDLLRKDQRVYKFRRFDVYPYGKDRIVLLSVENWKGNTHTFNYDNVTEVSDQLGRMLRLSYYYPEGLLQKVEEVIGGVVMRWVSFIYNDKGLLAYFTDAAGKQTEYAYYDEEGSPRHNLLRTIIYPNGNTVDVEYDENNKKATSIKLGDDPAVQIAYPSPGTTTVTDPFGNMSNYIHEHFRLIREEGPDLNPSLFEYNDAVNPSKPTRTVDRKGNSTWFSYDGMGNITRITNVEGRIALYNYNSKNKLTSHTEFHVEAAPITPTVYTYDTDGNRLRSVENPEHEIKGFNYDANYQLSSMEDGRGFFTHYAYDAYGNLSSVTDAEDNITEFTNDYAGRTTYVRDGREKEAWYTHDNLDHLSGVKNHILQETTMSYNDNGLLESVNWTNEGTTATTVYAYDTEDRLQSVTNALGRAAIYTYDVFGMIETRNDYKNDITNYGYDENHRLKEVSYPGGIKTTVNRDMNGRITSVSSPQGNSLFEYNDLNLLKKHTDPHGNILEYEYNDAGRLSAMIYPGSKRVTYLYDEAGRLKQVNDWVGGATTYLYDEAGNPKETHRPNGTKAVYTYDRASRLTGLMEQKPDLTAICSYAYALDGVGNHETVTVNAAPLSTPPLVTDVNYTYDRKVNRLLAAGSSAYTYDHNGNRIGRTGASGSTEYEWDNENMLKKAGSVEYYYDGLGNRITRVDGVATTKYVLDMSGKMTRVLAETDAGGAIIAYYVYGLGLISRITSEPNVTRRFYHYNYRGDTVALTDEDGNMADKYAYDGFGKLIDSEGDTPNPFKFIGRYGVMDEGDDLYFMRARFYDAEVGRFLSEDPLGFGAGDWNLYAYVSGNPILLSDPKGTNREDTEKRARAISALKEWQVTTEQLYYEEQAYITELQLDFIEDAMTNTPYLGTGVKIGLGITSAFDGEAKKSTFYFISAGISLSGNVADYLSSSLVEEAASTLVFDIGGAAMDWLLFK